MPEPRSLEELVEAGEVESALIFEGGMTERDQRIVEWFQERNDKTLSLLSEALERAEKAEDERNRLNRCVVEHHNIAHLSREAIAESIGGPCQICARLSTPAPPNPEAK